MKIESTPFQLTFPSSNTPKTENEKLVDPKESLKDTVQSYVEELDKALNGKGEDDSKVQQIMLKFRLGKKLSSSEMAYIKRHAPGLVNQIKEVMTKREILERSMKASKSKYGVHMAAYSATQLARKEPSAESQMTVTNHYSDAEKKYKKTEEYKEKPTSPLEKEEPMKRKKPIKKQWQFEPSTVYIGLEKQKSLFESKFEHKL